VGLDGVEILMQVEETFGVELTGEDASTFVTPEDIVNWVAGRVPVVPSDQCPSQRLFYALRRGFRSQLKALASSFGLETPLPAVVHRDHWPIVWQAVRAEVGDASWPESIPYPWMFGRGPKNVRELVWQVAASLPPPDVAAGEPWTRARIRLEVHRIIGEQVGTDAFHSRDRLVDDIGID
jgi:hypothetical protein